MFKVADNIFEQLEGAPKPEESVTVTPNAPIVPENGNIFDTLGGDLEAQTRARANARDRRAAYDRFRAAGGRRRFMAGARNLTSAIPFAGLIPGVRGFASPQAGSEEAGDLADYRLGQPIHSGIGTTLGRGLPYAALGAGIPALLSTLPRAAATGAAIEGGDEYTSGRGGNTGLAALMGAVSALPGWAFGRAVTPRSEIMSGSAWRNRTDAALARANRARREIMSDQPPGGPHGATPEELAQWAQRVAGTGTRALDEMTAAPISIPPVPAGADRVAEMMRYGAIGGAIGHIPGLDSPMMGAIMGSLLPDIRRRGIGLANRTIEGINRNLQGTPAGEALFRYFNNQVLSDADRALLHALGVPATQGGVEATGGRQIPTLGGR